MLIMNIEALKKVVDWITLYMTNNRPLCLIRNKTFAWGGYSLLSTSVYQICAYYLGHDQIKY